MNGIFFVDSKIAKLSNKSATSFSLLLSLFNLLSNRNDKGSIIITTNLTFDRWQEMFLDPMLTGAIVDRLAYKAHIMDISRDVSHRYQQTLTWQKQRKEKL